MVQVPASTITAPSPSAVRAADEDLPIAERAAALKRWIEDDNHAAAVFVSQQLQEADDGEDWQFVLVFATESIEFVSDELQAEVASELRRIALALRGDGRPGVEPVVYCALARYGSLVDASNADGYVEFLDPAGYVDTRLAALKSIIHLFEMSPPRDTDAATRLRDRVAELAMKFLDGDVFLAGQNSAIAKEAIVAMAAVGDARLLELMRLALQVDRNWFRRELKRRLDELRALWVEHGVAGDHAAFRRLVSAIALIRL